MSTDKNIKNYSAADFEKYWSGKLSAAEMHAMEKSAMDDPFLADALEGYKHTNTAGIDSADLRDKLSKRTRSKAPVFILIRKEYKWMRVAAAVIIIIGLGLLSQQLLLPKTKNNDLALTEQDDKNKSTPATNNVEPTPDTAISSVSAVPDSAIEKSDLKTREKISTNTTYTSADTMKGSAIVKTEMRAGREKQENATIITSPEVRSETLKEKDQPEKAAVANNTYSDNKKPSAAPNARQAYNDNDKTAGALLNNIYNYRVVDPQNNPVPFANVTNTRDNIGTYTDVKGLFNLISSDSTMNIQIRSLGYYSSNYKIVPSKDPSNLILKEDENARQEIMVNSRMIASSSPKKDTAQLIEPEVGWGYYNTYIANNIKIPEDVRVKTSEKDVELSFDVDRNGRPVNIFVTRSSQCKECDEEAIRLLKDGPKWKQKGKRKAFVKINIDK